MENNIQEKMDEKENEILSGDVSFAYKFTKMLQKESPTFSLKSLEKYFGTEIEYYSMDYNDWNEFKKDLFNEYHIPRGRVEAIRNKLEIQRIKFGTIDLPKSKNIIEWSLCLPNKSPICPSEIIIDDKYESGFGYSTLSEFLSRCPKDTQGICLKGHGFFEIGTLLEITKLSNNLKYIDLSNNRISPSCKNYTEILEILEILTKRGGVLILHTNPITSAESSSWFEIIIKKNPEFFCRLIWVHKKWLPTELWKNLILNGSTKLYQKIKENHEYFYYSNSKYLANFPKQKIGIGKLKINKGIKKDNNEINNTTFSDQPWCMLI